MKSLVILCALSLTGCATIERYPKTSAFIAASLLLSGGMAYRNHTSRAEELSASIPLTPDCVHYPEACK